MLHVRPHQVMSLQCFFGFSKHFPEQFALSTCQYIGSNFNFTMLQAAHTLSQILYKMVDFDKAS